MKRRFTRAGEAGGITVIDDYGHHPVEIAAVLKAARQAGARDVVAVVQPHRYSRLRRPVRGVLHLHERRRHGDRGRRLRGRRGSRIAGATRTRWSTGCARTATARVVPLPGPDRLAEMVHAIARPGDYVVCLGAGNITTWAHALPAQLAALQASRRAVRGGSGRAQWRPCRGRDVSHAPLLIAADEARGAWRGATRRWGRRRGSASAARRNGWCVRPMRTTCCSCCATLPTDVPVTVLGAASNLIVRDGGVRGVVLRLAPRLRRGRGRGGRGRGGCRRRWTPPWREHAAAAGLAGLEFLSGIPGSIGGAVAMNAGAYGAEVRDVLDWAEMATADGPAAARAATCGLSYRQRRCRRAAWWCGRASARGRASATAIAARMARDPRRAGGDAAGAGAHRRLAPSPTRPGNKAWALIDAAGCRGLRRSAARR